MNKLCLLLPFCFSLAFSDGFGIFAEGPTPINYGVFYSNGPFIIKNGYSYSNSSSENENDTATTSRSESNSFAVEVSPGLVLKTSFLDFEFLPAYRLTLTSSKTDFLLGSQSTSKNNSTSNAVKFNFIFSKEFQDRYKFGVGTTLINYAQGNSESQTDYANPLTKDSDTNSSSNSLTHGVSFFVSVYAVIF